MSQVESQGPIANAFESLLKKKLKAKMMSEGTSAADADAAIEELAGAHPLLDLFMQYGLPFILQLLSNLLALKDISPAPTPV